MSLLTKNKPAASQPKESKSKSIDYSAMPQVNLLPIEIIEKRNLKALQVKIAIYFLIFIAALVAAYALVTVEKKMAENRYNKAVEETARLKAEELKYAEVPLIKGQIANAEIALRDGMYREIDWNQYVGALSGTVPEDGLITEIHVSTATLNEAAGTGADPLQLGVVGTLSFTVDLLEIPDLSAWANSLNSIPGFRDARLSEAKYTKATDKVSYKVTGTVGLTEDAYTGRFEPKITEGEK